MIDLTSLQREVLNEIIETEPVSAPAVTAALGRPASSVKSAIDALCRMGLVESESYQRRGVVFMATEEAQDA